MSLKDAIARAKENRPQPVLVDVAIDDELYRVEVRRLDGMQWASITASAPPVDEASARLGYEPRKAALEACKQFGRLFDADGDEVADLGDDGEISWDAVFDAISGVEVQAIAATWWAMNAGDPNQRVMALKKASAGGKKTS